MQVVETGLTQVCVMGEECMISSALSFHVKATNRRFESQCSLENLGIEMGTWCICDLSEEYLPVRLGSVLDSHPYIAIKKMQDLSALCVC